MTDLLTWSQYPELTEWLSLLIFAIALLESLFVVGLMLPGVAMLATASWMAGQEAMSVIQLLVLGTAGAIAGDALGFYLGRYLAEPIYRQPLMQRHPHWRTRGETFFARYGVFSLLLGRFIGPIRPFIPFVAGSLQMQPRSFWLVNVISALFWAPIYLLPGYWLGTQSELLETRHELLLQIIASLLLILVVGYGLHHQLQPSRGLHRRLRKLPMPVAASAMGVCAAVALLILGSMRQFLPLPDNELRLHQWLNELPETLYPLTVAITSLGDLAAAGLIATLVVLMLVTLKLRRTALVFALLLLAVMLSNHLLKLLFGWPRPETGIALYSSLSFPSGHASTAAALFGMLAMLLTERLSEPARQALYGMMALPILLVPLSRVLLDLHWPLDVVAGLCQGLIAAALWRHWLARNPVRLKPWERVALLAGVTLVMVGYLYWRLPTALLFYQSAGAVS